MNKLHTQNSNSILSNNNVFLSSNGEIELFFSNESDHEQSQWHNNMEILMPLSGCYQIFIYNTCYNLNSHDICIIPKGVIHHLLPFSDTCHCLHLCLNQGILSQIPQLDSFLYRYYPTLFFTYDEFSSNQKQMVQLLLSISHLIQHENLSLTDQKITSLIIKFMQCSFDSMIDYDLLLPKFRNHDPLYYINAIQTICIYLISHCSSDLTQRDIADLFDYSPSYLNQLFHNIVGCSTSDFIQFHKLLLSIDLLVTTDLTIDQIQEYSGFHSISSYRRAFRCFFHEAPTVYRKKYLQF